MLRVLFVCTGNICRSPTAESVFRRLVADAGFSQSIEVASAGTHSYHAGDGADGRSTIAARRRGYDLSKHKARRLDESDLDEFDYVLAMDDDNMRHLRALEEARKARPTSLERQRAHLAYLLDYAPSVKWKSVPDPYAGGEQGFEVVLDIIESASEGLLAHIRRSDPPRLRES